MNRLLPEGAPAKAKLICSLTATARLVAQVDRVIGVGGIRMLQRLVLDAPERAAADRAPGLLEVDREGDGAGPRLAECDVVVHRVREEEDLLAVGGEETARVTVQRAAVPIGEAKPRSSP